MVDLGSQYANIKEEIDQALMDVTASSAFINGPRVKEFTANLKNYLDAGFVVPCANGTDALQISLMALGLEPGDEVITTPFTFVATAEVIALLGLKPVFVDIEEDTFNIDPNAIKSMIGAKTKTILPVHLYGQSANMGAIMEMAKEHGLSVVEDNAQAIGAEYIDGNDRRKTGTIGDIGCLSFYPTKNLGAFGDAGATYTNDEELYKKMMLITNHGSDRKYYYDSIGVNSRLDSYQAAILDIKLKHLDEYTASRNRAAAHYDNALGNHPAITIPARASYSTHVFHQYTIKVDGDRDGLQTYLREQSIPSMIYYPVPLHVSSAYAKYGYKEGDFPVSEKVSHQVISLPMHSELDEEQLGYITDHVIKFLDK